MKNLTKISNATIRMAVLALLLPLAACSSSRTSVHQNWLDQASNRIAVLPLSGDASFADEFTEALVNELVRANLSVMERTHLQQVMKEQKLQATGAVDPMTLVQTGQLAGVDFIVIGAVTTRAVTSVLDTIIGDGRARERIDTVRLRWVNVRTGQIVASAVYRNGRGDDALDIARTVARSLDRRITALQSSPAPVYARTSNR